MSIVDIWQEYATLDTEDDISVIRMHTHICRKRYCRDISIFMLLIAFTGRSAFSATDITYISQSFRLGSRDTPNDYTSPALPAMLIYFQADNIAMR